MLSVVDVVDVVCSELACQPASQPASRRDWQNERQNKLLFSPAPLPLELSLSGASRGAKETSGFCQLVAN